MAAIPNRADDMEKAKAFRVMGDWYLYLAVPRGGQIAFQPEAVSYFRHHGGNNSVEAQRQTSIMTNTGAS